MRSKLSLLVLLSVFAFSCKDDDKAPNQEEMLTGNGTKSWMLSASTDDAEETEESCRASSQRSQDNRWKFTKGGYFEFDRGIVTGDEDECEFCCSDLINFYGSWEISGGRLIITAEGELVSGTEVPFDEAEELLNHTLKSLTKDKFELTVDSYVATFVPAN
jgi:hypothetical protein